MKFFKVDFPNDKSIIVLNKNGWAELINVFNNFTDASNIFITSLSIWEAIKYILKKKR